MTGTALQKKLSTAEKTFLEKNRKLDSYYSTKKLGAFVENGTTVFRLFAPQAFEVSLVVKKNVDEKNYKEYMMVKDADGVWEVVLSGDLYGKFYGFKVLNNKKLKKTELLCLDPYAKAVASYNTYMGERLGRVIEENNFDWENDEWIQRDWSDLIIYEMHIKDQTSHPSSGVANGGTYLGLTDKGKTGGLSYIKSLGVNTVELLPSQEFANIEIPFQKKFKGKINTWNPYERNHWGYMTAAFFAPEAYYSISDKPVQFDKWDGTSGQQVNDFKEMVKAFHKEGIAVIMDVVYNHLSEYELGNLKEIDKEYYFRLDEKGNFKTESGCGNDLKTERPMVRKLIVENILYWMKEYHVDGFRFDLGKLIDWVTLEDIVHEAKKINPDVVFIAEPWGGGYDPKGMSLRSIASWNDQIRNGVKGENPKNGLGWIFGQWQGNNNPNRINSYVNGTLIRDSLGLFQKKEHSVNYLESHDGYTLGDFIRLGTKEVSDNDVIKNVDSLIKLSPLQMKLNKLAALFLFTSQGITMIHAGQEFARTKVIPFSVDAPDTNRGRIDHNTYDKDNEVNAINYHQAKINQELLNYYTGLISLRNKYDAFRKADYDDITFLTKDHNEFAVGYTINYNENEFLVLMNANPHSNKEFNLPEGNWEVLVNAELAGTKKLAVVNGKLVVPSTAGYVLKSRKEKVESRK
ncbi:MAG: alpha-amylase family glycosyl hydrolase [Ignavibacteriaceae bacterium]|nr:alpha-amylase family glycosyl hydrolase [Ignavibacteriaceae bacterium]